MNMPNHSFETTNISLATALLCTDYAFVEAGLPNDRHQVSDVVHLGTVVPDDSSYCQFSFAYTDAESFKARCVGFADESLMVHPSHYDKKKKQIVDSMRDARVAKLLRQQTA
ncbi:MAG: hypothetical protein ACYC63_04810 [Armatimonadota bacterium]